jgi:hypothetical protein
MNEWINEYVFVCVYVCMYVCMYYVYLYVCMYVCTYARAHIHVNAFRPQPMRPAFPLICFTAARTSYCSEHKIFTQPDDCAALLKFLAMRMIRMFTTQTEKFQLRGNNSESTGAFHILRDRAHAQLRGKIAWVTATWRCNTHLRLLYALPARALCATRIWYPTARSADVKPRATLRLHIRTY